MGRLDYSFMGRNLERLDQGYATYVTFIHMEIIHGHPILGKILFLCRNNTLHNV
jgi:hypothetical protein